MTTESKFITFNISKRHDSKGFSLWVNPLRKPWRQFFGIHFHWWARSQWNSEKKVCERKLPGGTFTFQFGPGAGYVLPFTRIAGATFYISSHAKGGSNHLYIPAKFRIGITRCASEIPYGFGS